MFIKEFLGILLEGGLLVLLAAAGYCLFEKNNEDESYEEKCINVKRTTKMNNFIIEDPDKIKKIL